MAPGASRNRDHAVDSELSAFSRMAVAGDIVEDQAAVVVNRLRRLSGSCAERQYDDGNLARDDDFEIGVEPRVALVGDEIDREMERRSLRDSVSIEAICSSSSAVVRALSAGMAPMMPRAALRDGESGRRGDEHRAGHDRDAKLHLQKLCQPRVASHGPAPNAIRP